jgi:hypothetical protein
MRNVDASLTGPGAGQAGHKRTHKMKFVMILAVRRTA